MPHFDYGKFKLTIGATVKCDQFIDFKVSNLTVVSFEDTLISSSNYIFTHTDDNYCVG